MAEAKPVHIPRDKYPDVVYPQAISWPTSNAREERLDEDVHLLDYWRIMVARRWTILAVLFTVVAATVVWSFSVTPIYEAEVTIQIDRENQNILSFKDVYEVDGSADDTLRTQFEVLRSRTLARRVIENLHLDRVRNCSKRNPELSRRSAKR